MIEIRSTRNADNRSMGDKPSIIKVHSDTKSHIRDVSAGLDFIAKLIQERGANHDYTKLTQLENFYNALVVADHTKDTAWYKYHIMAERHHLKSHVPDDVNLIDVIEHVVDCTMAGLARSGSVYDIDLDPEVLERAVNNTVKLLMNNTKVV